MFAQFHFDRLPRQGRGSTVDALDLLRCPRCRGRLQTRNERVACRDCGRSYPQIGGLPVLLEDADDEVKRWAGWLGELVEEIDGSLDNILAQLAGEGLLAHSRARLKRMHEALPVHRDRLVALFAAAGVAPVRASAGSTNRPGRADDERVRVPGEGTITAYYPQIHRDWGWPGVEPDETEAALAAIDAVLPPSRPLGRTLVLGAGPARLAYELAARRGAGPVVALDLNPLPYLVAARIFAGDTVDLFELPQQPLSSAHAMVDRRLTAPGPIPAGLVLAFADALDPPVDDGAFDTVVTPWFIDQVPHDLRDLVPVIHRVLAQDGAWLDHGPCIHHPNHTRLAHRYRFDEVLEIVDASGFHVDAYDHRAIPYLASPASAQSRTEMVLTFWARRVAITATETSEPGWLSDPTLPVPPLEGVEHYVPPHPMFAAVVALVDGRRSIAEIADALVRSHGLPQDAARMGVAGCLREIRRALAER
jgi:uncharacterized protein YbaR (Trm112 family)/SAM-dependent methyltransferase